MLLDRVIEGVMMGESKSVAKALGLLGAYEIKKGYDVMEGTLNS